MPAQVFREYDIRGVADRDLGDEVAGAIGRGYATAIGQGRSFRVAVGRDCRLSSDRLFAALTQGLRRAGAHVVDIGVGPTPDALHAAAHALGTEGSVHDHPGATTPATRTASR